MFVADSLRRLVLGRLGRNILWNIAAIGLPVLVALVAIPSLLARLGTARVGCLTLAFALLGFASVFDFGLGRALTKFVSERIGSERRAEVPRYVSVATKASMVMGAFVAVTMLVASGLLDVAGMLQVPVELREEFVSAFRVAAIAVPLVVLSVVFRGVLEGFGDFRTVALWRMFFGCVSFGGPLISSFYTQHLSSAVGTIVLGRLFVVVALGRASKEHISVVGTGTHPSNPLRELIAFGGWLTVSNLLTPIMTYLDRFILASLVGVGVLAFYTVPYEMITKVLVLPAAVTTVLFPRFAELIGIGRSDWVPLFRQALRYLATSMGGIVLLLIVVGREGLSLWIDERFAVEALGVWRVLALGVFFNAMAHVPYAAIQAAGRADITAKVHLVELPIYLVGLVVLTQQFGILGAAIAWTTRMCLDLVLLLSLAWRIMQPWRME
jgi:O-antigen/teichoic acid export membrane protein